MALRVPLYGQGIVYGRWGLVYRRPLDLVPPAAAGLTQPRRPGVTLRLYDRQDVLQRIVSSNAQRSPLLALNWELLDSGCGSFDLELAEDLGVEHGWRVDVHLWNDPDPVYSGFVRELPGPGTTEQTWEISGHGAVDYFDKVLLTGTYQAQQVRGIVLDIIRQAEQRLRIIVDDGLIAPTTYILSGQMKFLRTSLRQALQQLANLAGGYVWGVGADRRFFFRPPSQAIDLHRWVGKHLETYVPRSDSSQLANRIFVKFGKVRDDLSNTSPFYKTNWGVDPVEDFPSQETYGLLEGEYSAPSVLNLIDAYWAASAELKRRKQPIQRATVRGLEYNGEPLTAEGLARIVGRGGHQLILRKKRLKYTLRSGSRVEVGLDLGEQLPETPASWFSQIVFSGAAEALARQQSQVQL